MADTPPYNEHERDLVFLARLAESIAARDWSRARAIWRQLAPLHERITPLQNLDAVLAFEEALELQAPGDFTTKVTADCTVH